MTTTVLIPFSRSYRSDQSRSRLLMGTYVRLNPFQQVISFRPQNVKLKKILIGSLNPFQQVISFRLYLSTFKAQRFNVVLIPFSRSYRSDDQNVFHPTYRLIVLIPFSRSYRSDDYSEKEKKEALQSLVLIPFSRSYRSDSIFLFSIAEQNSLS